MPTRSPTNSKVVVLGICAALLAVPWHSGSHAVQAQVEDVADCATENEPNDTLDQAQAVLVANCGDGPATVRGRLEGFEADVYRIEVPEGSPTLRDVTVTTAAAAPHGLCLRSSTGAHRQCRQGAAGSELPDLLLTPGNHYLEITGGSDSSFDYELRVQTTGTWTEEHEAEPNDDLYSASGFDLAKGVTGDSVGADDDNLAASVSGPPRLWEIVVTGEELERVWWLGERGVLAQASMDPEQGRAVMTDLLLGPGTHTFLVRAKGAYALEATPLGTPADEAEREPNDVEIHAEMYLIGERRVGRLPGDTDVDRFRFTATTPEHLLLTLDQPADADIEVRLSTAGLELLRKRAKRPGDTIRLDLWLPPGDHDLSLHPLQPSAERYELTTARADPFMTVPDREPNDVAGLAAPVPATLEWRGASDSREDVDWYALPPLSTPGAVRVSVEPPATRVELWAGGSPVTSAVGPDGDLVWSDMSVDASLLLAIRADGDYRLAAQSDGWVAEPEPELPTLDISISLPADAVAAYWPEAQLVEGTLSLANTGPDVLDVELEAVTSHFDWAAVPETDNAEMLPGATIGIPLRLEVAPDAWSEEPVRVSVAARSLDGGTVTTHTFVEARPEIAPVQPRTASTVPPELLGGLNVASLALGATPLDVPGAQNVEALYDGVTPIGPLAFVGPTDDLPLDIVVDLAGDGPVPVAGMMIDPMALDGLLGEVPREVELLLSTDGATWTRALAATVSPLPQEQSFVAVEPMAATHAMLRVHSLHGYGRNRVSLGEWKVVAMPGAVPDPTPLNIADPARGGHVVSYAPFQLDLGSGYRMLDADQTVELVWLAEGGDDYHAIIGFHEGRAAQLDRLTWHDGDGASEALRLDRVDVAISLDGPLGPWEDAGEWQLARDANGSVAPYAFVEPTWARYIRLSSPLPDDAVQFEFPAAIEVTERAADETYRSILGQWGKASELGPYEWLSAAPTTVGTSILDAGDGPDDATPLSPGQQVAQHVEIGSDVDWYRVEVPIEDNTLSVDVTGTPQVGVSVSVVDDTGDPAPTTRTQRSGGIDEYRAVVEGGRTYHVVVEQPPASIAIAYDTSGSMGTFYDLVIGSLRAFAADVEPGHEAVMAFPFGYAPLLDGFVDDRYALESAITDASLLGGISGTSNAEEALIDATAKLAERDGRRAILVVTDAESPTENLTPELWAALDEVRPVVHAIHIANVSGPRETRDRMRAWAHSSGGHYENATTLGEMTRAFERLAAWLRRPAGYSLTAHTRSLEHPPGRLVVRSPHEGPAATAGPGVGIEIILDTSGSMRKGIDGKRRIQIAKESMRTLLTDTLDEGVPVAIRTFGAKGKRKGSGCRTRLALPLAPLDRKAALRFVRQLDAPKKASTPIAEALAHISDDLAGVEGSRIVLLITDGAESCGGDPEAAIAALAASGLDVTLNIVGFALDDEELKARMAGWAQAGGGAYYDARNGKQLARSVEAALATPVRVFDAGGAFVGGSSVGGAPLELAPGDYRVEVLVDPAVTYEAVQVAPSESVELMLPIE